MAIRSESQFAAVAVAASGDNTLVAAVTGKRIRLLGLMLVASGGANNIKFKSDPGGTDLTGVMNLPANGQFILPMDHPGWVQTVAGQALVINCSAATALGGALTYVTLE